MVLLDKVAPAAATALDIYWFCLLACLAWSFDAFWLFMVPLEEAFALFCCTWLALALLLCPAAAPVLSTSTVIRRKEMIKVADDKCTALARLPIDDFHFSSYLVAATVMIHLQQRPVRRQYHWRSSFAFFRPISHRRRYCLPTKNTKKRKSVSCPICCCCSHFTFSLR